MDDHPQRRRHPLIELELTKARAELEVAAAGLPAAVPVPRPDALFPDHLGEVNPVFREHLLRGLERYVERPPTRVDFEGLRSRTPMARPVVPLRRDAPAPPVNRRRPQRD